jgi:hypothetical protein
MSRSTDRKAISDSLTCHFIRINYGGCMPKENQCILCDKLFVPSKWHPDQKACSEKCRNVARGRISRGFTPKKLKINCAVCENEFLQKHLNNSKYCSPSCKKLGVFRQYKGLPIKGPRKHVHGTGHITSNGYRIISKNHPNAKCRSPNSGKGQIMEHVWIMSNHIGRPLEKHENVHHKNGIRDDNRIENLELWSRSQPPGQRVEEKIVWCKEFLDEYGFDVIKRVE